MMHVKVCEKLGIRIYSVGVWNSVGSTIAGGAGIIRIYSVGVWNDLLKIYDPFRHTIRIYSVGVWNSVGSTMAGGAGIGLEFTPLEFETWHLQQRSF